MSSEQTLHMYLSLFGSGRSGPGQVGSVDHAEALGGPGDRQVEAARAAGRRRRCDRVRPRSLRRTPGLEEVDQVTAGVGPC